MSRLPSQSTRSTIRTITLLAALTSLLLTMVAPFATPAEAGTVSPFSATDGVLDAGAVGPAADSACGSGDDTQPVGGAVKLVDIHDAPAPVIESKTLGAPKSDLCNLWTKSAVDADGDIWLYVGLSRFGANGSTVTYIELFDVAPSCDVFSIATCNPFQTRDQGSQVIAFDFQGNDADIDARLRTWNAGTGLFGPLSPLGSSADGRTGQAGLFAEFSVNLTDVGILPNINDNTECDVVAAALPYTVTGNADNASMIDILLAEIDPISNCGSLRVEKQVVGDDDFGTAFPITAAGTTQSLGDGEGFTVTDLFAGDTTVSEDLTGLDGWSIESIACSDGSASGPGVTSLDGVTISVNQTTTCTVTNAPDLPTITLDKTVVNDDGGTATEDDFQASISPTVGDVAWDATTTVAPGTHTAAEVTLFGYDASDWGGDCAADGSVTVALGDDVTCSITNDDVAPTITLEKTVVNDDGGTAVEDDFQASISPTVGDVAWDATTAVAAGDYTAAETTLPGYSSDGWGGDCAADGSITTTVGGAYTCTIVNDDVPAGLTIVKTVVNDDGGQLQATDFPLHYTPDGGVEVTVENQVTTSVPAGTYTIGETQQDGYELTGISCDDGTTAGAGEETVEVTVPNGATVVCTITNDDIAPTVTLVKTVVNDDGGTLTQDDFPSFLDGEALAWDTTVDVQAGAHTASETQQPGYVAGDWGGDCDADGSFTAELDTDYVCTITNDDQPATVVLRKTVVNDDGGTLDQDDFAAFVDGQTVGWDAVVAIDAGDHSASETTQPGYAAGDWGGDCDADGGFTAVLGQTYECTITNDDIAPTITLVKTVVNDDGGTLTQDDFPSFLDGEALAWDTTVDTTAGDHAASETTQPGYTAGDWGGDCATDGSFTAELDTDYVCSVTNDDEPGTLVLTKVVENLNGGTATEDDFTPTTNEDLEGEAADQDAVWGENTVSAGTYRVDERDADGSSYLADGEYVQVSIVCSGEPTDVVTVANGETEECVVTNRDVPAGLTVVKQVTNNWGGTLGPEDVPLTVDGESVDSGAFTTFPAGDHTIAEQQQPGYELVSLTCVSDRTGELDLEGAESVSVSLGLNENVVCTFVNRDVPPSLTVLKEVVNDDGGTATVDDFTPLVDDTEAVWGSQDITIGDQTGTPVGSYTIGEVGADGYALTGITCSDETTLAEGEQTVTVDLGLADDVTCTLVNDDVAPTVVLTKVVVNDDGGTATVEDFPVTFDGEAATWGEVVTTTAGAHVAAEVQQPGYLTDGWTGDCDADGSLTTEVGGTYACTIVNDDVPAGLTVVKEVVNDDGGTATVDDFPLLVTPEGEAAITVTSGAETVVGAGTYTVSEEQQPGYALDGITCDNGVVGDGEEATVTVGLDEAVVCTIVNDDLPVGIQVVKVPNVDEIEFDPTDGDDEVIVYTYTVTNTGETTLTDLGLVDDVLGDIALPVDTLLPGQTVVVTAEHVVTQADADAEQVVNVVIVEGTSPDGRTTDDDDRATVDVTTTEVDPDITERPVPPAPTPPQPAPVLPVTGVDVDAMALFAALVAGLGALLLIGTSAPVAAFRRRRH